MLVICRATLQGFPARKKKHKPILAFNFQWSLAISFSYEMETEGQKPLTWIDSKTGLQWQYESPGRMNWYEAERYAKSLILDGKGDWRLPTIAELESLLDRAKNRSDGRPIMRQEVPFKDGLSYWSSTTFGEKTKNAWILMFDGAYILSYYKSNRYYVRCVRGKANYSGGQ